MTRGKGNKPYRILMISITDKIAIHPSEIEERFIRASGPGGQNVNKVETGVQLRFDLAHSPAIPPAMRARAANLAGKRLTKAGTIVITATRFRTQEQNRADALQRLIDLLKAAARKPLKRKPTRPTMASRKRRMEAKKKRGMLKKLRSRRPPSD